MAKSRSAKICEKTVLVVSQEVGDRRGTTFTRRRSALGWIAMSYNGARSPRATSEIAVNSAVVSTNRGSPAGVDSNIFAVSLGFKRGWAFFFKFLIKRS